jgi:hypothetical protein
LDSSSSGGSQVATILSKHKRLLKELNSEHTIFDAISVDASQIIIDHTLKSGMIL